MTRAKTVRVAFATGCIAVKEDYTLLQVYGTQNYNVTANFCVDRMYSPCKLCVMKGTNLRPISQIPNFNLGTFISSKKGVYSRLDCVTLYVSLKGTFTYINGVPNWVNVDLELFSPVGVSQDSELSVVNLASCVSADVVDVTKRMILEYLGAGITSKENFIMSRI